MVRLQKAELQDPDGSITHLEAFGTGDAGCEALALAFTAWAATSLALNFSPLLHQYRSGPLSDISPRLPAIHQTGFSK
jgi:hypothetical protein